MRTTKHECAFRILAHPDDPKDRRVLVGCRCTKTKIAKTAEGFYDLCCEPDPNKKLVA